MMDSLGDRMKMYEGHETQRRFLPLIPIYARLDGRSFSRFTRGMDRPYDANMSRCMIETAKYLVKETNATIGYTQSDEISLVWKNNNPESEMLFDGKVFKWVSILSSIATAKFNREAAKHFSDRLEKALPTFDARAYQLPSLIEASNVILWRVNDAVKNSITMAAGAYYSHNELHGKNSNDKHEMLHAKGVNWNDYPRFFKEGTFVKRVARRYQLSANELPAFAQLTEQQVYMLMEEGVIRTTVEEMEWPMFKTITNKVEALFSDAEPTSNPEAYAVNPAKEN